MHESDGVSEETFRRWYPHWDENYANVMESTDELFVETEAVFENEGHLRIRRTVSKKAYRQKDRHLLWQGDVAIIERDQVPQMVKDIVSSLI